MSIAPAPAALHDLSVGDAVIVKRCLTHPAWKNENVAEVIGKVGVIDRREIPAVPGWGGREATSMVRLASDHWYDLADGIQDNSGATRIELEADQSKD